MTSEKKYFSIGEIAKISNMPIKTIRYYDEIGLLKPAFPSWLLRITEII